MKVLEKIRELFRRKPKILVTGGIVAEGYVSVTGGCVSQIFDNPVNENDYDIIIIGDMNINSMTVKRGTIHARRYVCELCITPEASSSSQKEEGAEGSQGAFEEKILFQKGKNAHQ